MVGLRPQVCAALGVRELNDDAKLCARLSQAALHDVARPDLRSYRACVSRLVGIADGRSARHDTEVRKP